MATSRSHLLWIIFCHVACGLRQEEILQFEKAGLKVEVSTTGQNTITISSNGLPAIRPDKRHRDAQSYNMKFQVLAYPSKLTGGVHVCLPAGIIGMSIDGIPIHNPYTEDCCNAGYVNRNKMDGCWGKLDEKNRYYHDVPPLCAFKNQCNTSTLIGVAIDGFPIYGPYDALGRYIDNLDECNGKDDYLGGYRYLGSEPVKYCQYQNRKRQGHTIDMVSSYFPINKWAMIGYHISENFPYMIGCLRSNPLSPIPCGCAALKPSCGSSNFPHHLNKTSCCHNQTTCSYITNPLGGSAKRLSPSLFGLLAYFLGYLLRETRLQYYIVEWD